MYAKPLKFGLYCKLTVHLDLDSQELHSPMLLLCCWMGTMQRQSPHCCHTPCSPGPRHPFRFYCCSTESLLVIPTLQKLPRSP